jgi:predicted amidohydrolase YtcJ
MLTGSQETAVHLDDAVDMDDIVARLRQRAANTEKESGSTAVI